MPSYDDDRLTEDEQNLLFQLINVKNFDERLQTLIRLKNLLIGSQRSKSVFLRANLIEYFRNFLFEFSSKNEEIFLCEIFDCLTSLSKFSSDEIFRQFDEFEFVRQTFVHLSFNVESNDFVQSALRFLRSFAERSKSSFENLSIESFDLLRDFLSISTSRRTQIVVIEILSSISIDSNRIEELAERIYKILRENLSLVK